MRRYVPMTAVLTRTPFSDPHWLFERNRDLRPAPLRERKRVLRRTITFGGRVRFTPHRVGDGEAAFRDACTRGWEGVIAKRADSPYVPGRSRDWLKFKCERRQELVIGGWTPGRGARHAAPLAEPRRPPRPARPHDLRPRPQRRRRG
jgi:ATP-dependent DNA ligase